MRNVGIAQLEVGDVLAKAVHGHNGIVMLEAGTVLTDKYIDRLKALRISSVQIGFSGELAANAVNARQDRMAPEWIRPNIAEMKNDDQSRKEAVKLVAEFAEKGAMPERLLAQFPDFRKKFRDILLEIVAHPGLAAELGVVMGTDRILFEHSLNVTLCSSILGSALGFDGSKQFELALGAMFSDIGMTRIPHELAKANRELTESEMTILRQHTSEGYRVLKGIKEVPLASAQCALLHHERYQGNGYPLGMTNENIPEFARIVAIADVYNALGAARHHRNAYRPAEAVEYLLAAGNYHFDWGLVKAFLGRLVIYPVGTEVMLSDGRAATVMETAGKPLQQPIVKLAVARGKEDGKREILDLQLHPSLVIVGKAGQ
ncbi:HD-GYP domain-containing protein [Cohnella suwonensis]|uniref:HD-GYP domain-containing protein n=1 Tax=Cohnella suwonensis TaxID=696072 RepID=A0ABW0LV39_9BACL